MLFTVLLVVSIMAVILAGAYWLPYIIVRKCGKIVTVIISALYGVYLVELVASCISLIQSGELLQDPVIYVLIIIFMFAVQAIGIYGIIKGYKNRVWWS
jgi:hypothetical protein